MEQTIYVIALVLTGLTNLGMGAYLYSGSNAYRQQTVYYRSRLLTVLWLVTFG